MVLEINGKIVNNPNIRGICFFPKMHRSCRQKGEWLPPHPQKKKKKKKKLRSCRQKITNKHEDLKVKENRS